VSANEVNLELSISTRDVPSKALACAECPRDAAIIVNGLLVWKCYHDKQLHANVRPMKALIDIYLKQANNSTLREIVERIEREIEGRLNENRRRADQPI